MRCAFKIAVCLAGLMAYSHSAWAESFDFRSVRWGMNRYEVMASELGPPRRLRRDEILYGISLFKRPTHLMYRFYEDRLVAARYVLPLKANDTLETLDALLSLHHGTSFSEATDLGEARVWMHQGRTLRLFIPKKGQAVIDVISDAATSIPSKEMASLRRRASHVVRQNL